MSDHVRKILNWYRSENPGVLINRLVCVTVGYTGFGSIIGRNTFQRGRTVGPNLLDRIVRIYSGESQ